MEESFETTTVRRKTVRQSIKIEEVSNEQEWQFPALSTWDFRR